MNSTSISEEHERRKRAFRKTRPIDLRYFSVKEADHFFGWHTITSVGKDVPHIPDNMHNELPFHCEVKLNQIDLETGVCFRNTCTRIKHGNIISFEYDGIPKHLVNHYKQRSLIIYRLVYPDGLTLEDIQDQ